jgi:hypothetical protein
VTSAAKNGESPHFYFLTGEFGEAQSLMVDIYPTTERCFFRERTHKIFRAPPRFHFLLQVR